jgi:cystathionine beta-lyase/cystathionine gamma-synthase
VNSDSAVDDIATLAIHGGQLPDPATGAILTPIYQTTTFRQEAVGVHKGYTYTRSANPTVSALERNLGAIEGALPAASFVTGMAALAALFLATLSAGDRVVISKVIYGGTVRLLRRVLDRFGVRAVAVDTSDVAALRAELRAEPAALVLVESPGNPTLLLTDIAAVSAAAREAGALLAVDNTLLTPVLQRPLDLGADVVVHSTTKYIEGHNSTVGGALVTRDAELLERIRFVQNAVGFSQAPFGAWLTQRGLKTLPLRMERHSQTALEVARWLEGHPAVAQVAYPWLESFPQLELARRQQSAGGGMISFELAAGAHAAVRMIGAVRLCALAENLGAAESLITHPTTMTHAALTAGERAEAGISDGLIRLSVGLEDGEAIVADLARALERAGEEA